MPLLPTTNDVLIARFHSPCQLCQASTMDRRRCSAASSLLLVVLCLARPVAAKEGDKNPMVS